VTTCFMLTSIATHLSAMYFLTSPKSWKLLTTGIVTAYSPMSGGLSYTLPGVLILHPGL